MEYSTIGFVRRGFSCGGGAEAYLKRLATGVLERGHKVLLFTSHEWPDEQWGLGPIVRLDGKSSMAFADSLIKIEPRLHCNVLMSLERIWHCDVYRAGDGVHQAWLQRRAEIGGPFRNLGQILNRKHAAALALEGALLGEGGACRVIANSRMVKNEIFSDPSLPTGEDRRDLQRRSDRFVSIVPGKPAGELVRNWV
jgi:UDP-glucose:(heptosyl)LPS alpha-1,3-glucosyltransferase